MVGLCSALEIEVSLPFLAGSENASLPGTTVACNNLIEPDCVISSYKAKLRTRLIQFLRYVFCLQIHYSIFRHRVLIEELADLYLPFWDSQIQKLTDKI